MNNAIKKLKLMPICISGLMFVLGAVLAGVSSVIGGHVSVLVGVAVLAIGITRIIYGFKTYKTEHDARLNIIIGVLDAIWAIFAIIFTGDTGIFVFLFGIWLLISAFLEIVIAARYVMNKVPNFWGLFIDAGVNLTFGVIMMTVPMDFVAVIQLTAVYLVFNAFTTILITTISLRQKDGGAKPAKAEAAKEVVVVEVDSEIEIPVTPVKVITDDESEKTPAVKKPAAKKSPTKTTTVKTTTTKTTTAKKPAATATKKPTTATVKKPAATKK